MPVAGGGSRVPWLGLPRPLRVLIEKRLGSQVVEAVSMPGGFTPGLASTLRTRSDVVFVKAISAALTPEGPEIYRREAAITAALPSHTPAPRLLWSYDDGEWVVLVFDHVEGRPPDVSRPHELECVLDAMTRLASCLDPSPIAAPRLVTRYHDDVAVWQSWAGGRAPAALDSYGAPVVRAVERLADLADGWPLEAMDPGLLHGALRADNMILTPAGGVVMVDWPEASIGARWMDLLMMMPSLAVQGVCAEDVTRRHPLTRGVPRDQVDAVIAALAGFFVSRSLLPAPQGLPTVRAFQRAQGTAALEWLGQRRPGLL